MQTPPPIPPPSSTLGNASLGLGLASAALVFGIGLCALTGRGQNWLPAAATPLFVCGASSAFLGLLGAGVGAAGLFGRGGRATAAVGLALGLLAVCLFLGVLAQFQGA
jgi:hypothetical protein